MSESANVSQTAEPETQSSSELQAGENQPEPTPSIESPEPTPRGLNDSGLRFQAGDDVPSWAVGKTAQEVLDLSKQMYGALQAGQPAPSTPAPTPVYETPTPSQSPSIDPNLLYSNPEAYTQAIVAEAKRQAQAELKAQAPAFVAPLAAMAKTQARTYKPEIWNLYGPQIESTMATLPEASRADVSTWQRIVDYVAGQHVEDLVAREVAKVRGTDSGMLSSQGGPPTGEPQGGSPIRKLFKERPDIASFYKEANLSPEDVIAHGKRMGHNDESEYAKMLTRKFRGAK